MPGESFQSLVVVVTQPASAAVWLSVMFGVGAKSLAGDLLLSFAVVVGQLAGMHFAKAFRNDPLNCPWLASLSGTVNGVGHEPQPLADVRGADARSRNTGRREGVADSFHVSLNKVEPSEAVIARNLFTKDNRRLTLTDEPVPGGP